MANELVNATMKFMQAGEYRKALDCIAHIYNDDKKLGYRLSVAFRSALTEQVKNGVNAADNYELLHQAYVLVAKDYFDEFMIALEWYRPAEQKFWLVRRERLLEVCEALQMMANDELDELFLSMPPRVGKSSLVLFFTLWMMCRNSERSNLYSSFTEKVVETYYNGIMEVMTDPVTYDLHGIFPKFKIASTNAKDLLVNLGRKKRYPSLTCRSIDGTLNGACDADGLIIADDLHSGIEEARSKEQLDKKWFTVTNNLLSRKKHDGKILWIGTRWSVADCISNRIEMLETNADCAHIRYKIVNCPAFNEKEESNFDYMFNKGFTTNEYKVIRASFELKDDMASWLAQYMGQPIERDGSVFAPSDMRYYNGELPADTDPDRIFMAVDPAWGGGDFVAAPIIYQYGDDLFVHDVVYNNGDKSVTEPMVVAKAIQHDVAMITVEATKTTRSYSEDIDSKLRERGYRLNIQTTTKNWTGTGKLQRIFDKSVDIKERMIFRDGNHRDKEYSLFMQNVFSFTVNANKHKHDDAPDSLCIAIQVAFFAPQKAHIRKRIF